MHYKLKIETFNNYIHYYLNDIYIGMLVFDKGELSDHRAIIRKNKLNIINENLYDNFKVGLYGLLNHYLSEREFMSQSSIDTAKTNIVKENNDILEEAVNNVNKNYLA